MFDVQVAYRINLQCNDARKFGSNDDGTLHNDHYVGLAIMSHKL